MTAPKDIQSPAEYIKFLFDVVRNYALTAAVLFAGASVGRYLDPTVSTLERVSGRILTAIGILLLLTNMVYSTYLVPRSGFIKNKLLGTLWTRFAQTILLILGPFLLAVSFVHWAPNAIWH